MGCGFGQGHESLNNLGWKNIGVKYVQPRRLEPPYLCAHTGKGTWGRCCCRDTSGMRRQLLRSPQLLNRWAGGDTCPDPIPIVTTARSGSPLLALGSLSRNPGVPREGQAPLPGHPEGPSPTTSCKMEPSPLGFAGAGSARSCGTRCVTVPQRLLSPLDWALAPAGACTHLSIINHSTSVCSGEQRWHFLAGWLFSI